MSKKKLTEKELLEGMTPHNSHCDLLAKSEVKPDVFLSNLKLALDTLPDGDIEFCDLGNEIGRVIASLNSSPKCHLRDVLHGIEHGFDLIAKAKGVENE